MGWIPTDLHAGPAAHRRIHHPHCPLFSPAPDPLPPQPVVVAGARSAPLITCRRCRRQTPATIVVGVGSGPLPSSPPSATVAGVGSAVPTAYYWCRRRIRRPHRHGMARGTAPVPDLLEDGHMNKVQRNFASINPTNQAKKIVRIQINHFSFDENPPNLCPQIFTNIVSGGSIV